MFSTRLKLLRKEKKLTQGKLGDYIGVSYGTIAMWETAKREPDFATISKLATFFDVSTDYLLGRAETKKEPVDGTTSSLEQNFQSHGITAEAWDSLPDESKSLIFNMIKQLKNSSKN